MINRQQPGAAGYETPMPLRRWFAFRLRTLFVLVAVLSIPLAWVAYSLNWIRERREFKGFMVRYAQEKIRPAPYGFSEKKGLTPSIAGKAEEISRRQRDCFPRRRSEKP